jgi:hypothetical protein
MNNSEKRALLNFLANIRGVTTTDVPTFRQPRALKFIGMACQEVSKELASARGDADPVRVMTEQARWLDRQVMGLQAELLGEEWEKPRDSA